MNWIVPATLCAVFFGAQGLYVRWLHLKKVSDSSIILFSYFFFALPFLLVPAAGGKLGPLQHGFWPLAILVAAINVAGFYFFIRALEFSQASLVMPVLATSPLAVIPVSILLLGETPGRNAFFAILIIIAGCYILTAGRDLAEPFKKIGRDKGLRWAFLTVFIWAFVANLDKMALMKSNTRIYPLILSSLISLFSLPFVAKKLVHLSKKTLLLLALGGLLNAGALITHFMALSITKVAYLITVKRSGVLLGVAGGIIFFREKEPLRRLIAATVILAGNVMLYIFS